MNICNLESCPYQLTLHAWYSKLPVPASLIFVNERYMIQKSVVKTRVEHSVRTANRLMCHVEEHTVTSQSECIGCVLKFEDRCKRTKTGMFVTRIGLLPITYYLPWHHMPTYAFIIRQRITAYKSHDRITVTNKLVIAIVAVAAESSIERSRISLNSSCEMADFPLTVTVVTPVSASYSME